MGHAATRAIKAFGDGDYAEAVRLLRPIRSYTHPFGGSHAQRDVIDLTLIEAASRAGQDKLAAALLAERFSAKREIPLPPKSGAAGVSGQAEDRVIRVWSSIMITPHTRTATQTELDQCAATM